MNEWNIQSRAHACETCQKPFADKEPYHTMLFDEKQEFRRLDVCQTCWTTQHAHGGTERKGFVSYWQGIYEAPPKPADPMQKETADTLLRKLIELDDPQHGAACFILAVMLERKRLLKVKEQIIREDGKRVFVYEQPATGDVFTITDPNLQLNQLDAVQRDVAHLMEHGLNPPGSNAPADTAPGSDEAVADAPPETVADEEQPDKAVPAPE